MLSFLGPFDGRSYSPDGVTGRPRCDVAPECGAPPRGLAAVAGTVAVRFHDPGVSDPGSATETSQELPEDEIGRDQP